LSDEIKLKRLVKKFEKEKKELLSIGIFLKGSISERWMTCGNPACSCKKDRRKRHGPYQWWTTKEKGRTKAILIPPSFLEEAKTYLENHTLLQRKISRLYQLSEQITRIKVNLHKMSEKEKP
jgi:hypothetical protein